MNQIQMIQLLDTLSIPSFYDHAPVGTALPFIAIHSEQPDNFLADDVVYCEKWNFRIDLYSVEKSLDLESEIKKLLNQNHIVWQKTEQFISEQECWEVEWEFELLGNEVLPEPDPPTPDDEGGEDDGT